MNEDKDSQASGERRRRFMEIALRRFAKDGYHVTKISDIVAEAGVAQGTFYWHFKSKEAIALEIVLDGRRQLLEVIAQGYRRETGTVQDMVQVSEALLARLFLFAESNRDLMEMLLGGIGAIEPIRQEIAETRAAMERAFLQNIRRAIELGMLPAEIDAEVRAALIMSLIEGVIARWLFGLNAPGSGISSKTAEQLASETARFEFFGLLGI
ncbi:transcriptional regulator, TetR family [Paenibacillus sp. RU4T]|nr:transcriptional regulator, TetR family [Paenibacillus sp. RU4X]SIR26545.1 transcriptional regulator, TetR family [Paenibacillus sp. RU4T]